MGGRPRRAPRRRAGLAGREPGQGYHFSQPLEGVELTGYLERQFGAEPARHAA
jgi:hypothetical protein